MACRHALIPTNLGKVQGCYDVLLCAIFFACFCGPLEAAINCVYSSDPDTRLLVGADC